MPSYSLLVNGRRRTVEAGVGLDVLTLVRAAGAVVGAAGCSPRLQAAGDRAATISSAATRAPLEAGRLVITRYHRRRCDGPARLHPTRPDRCAGRPTRVDAPTRVLDRPS
jgi:hypothetical protein